MVNFTRPTEVGNVDHAVDTFLEAHESPVSSEVANRAVDLGANRVTALDLIPWIGLQLTDPERDFLLFDTDSKHNRLNLLIQFKHVTRPSDPLDP